jgi:uncharacterized protein (UPF0332 family)
MSFDWVQLLQFATSIESSPESPGPSEAALRAAISRAYYAALHLCRGYAFQEGWTPSRFESIHQAVPKYLRHHQPSDKIRRKMAHELDLLRALRVEADYEETLRGRPEFLAAKAVALAKSIVAKLDSLRASTVNA